MTYQNQIQTIDDAKAEAFADRFVGTLNEAALGPDGTAELTDAPFRLELEGDLDGTRIEAL
ncbi:hypothetical protein ILP92_05025 [Maribius pontilimi]|uniref:Uncharacterized protein n=1 Tax=Palleronia pontilimi TaxID=1964209 RepID=A0A934MC36_9RHOB|nr:hypothetical protein [Palleronia pontilimi]MBJ3762105.1 hypothetical protein [Palleronia pontilimi]